MKFSRILVTGGRGFIGSHFVEKCLQNNHTVIDLDSMTYASNKNLPFDNNENYTLHKEDISKIRHLPPCDIVVNFAAESHVDNSIESPKVFFESNIKGTFNLLELIRGKIYDMPIFFHISTDEVYGDIRDYWFTEDDRLNPGNPYSATKASAEMLTVSYGKTYNINYLISRSSNNYGPRQYCEKLIPKIIDSIKHQKKIPIHGDGSYVRDWIYVKDNTDAIYHIMNNSEYNQIYNISANNHLTNLEVVQIVCSWFGINDYMKYVDFVPNRLGQDIRYSISNDKLQKLGFSIPLRPEKLLKFI